MILALKNILYILTPYLSVFLLSLIILFIISRYKYDESIGLSIKRVREFMVIGNDGSMLYLATAYFAYIPIGIYGSIKCILLFYSLNKWAELSTWDYIQNYSLQIGFLIIGIVLIIILITVLLKTIRIIKKI